MAVSSISSSVTPYVPTVVKIVGTKQDGLATAKLKDADESDTSTGLVYSASGLTAGKALPAAAVYLKDGDDNYFSLDTDNISMVAKGKDLNLYVYAADGTTDRYTFNATTGKMDPTKTSSLSAQEFSAVEVEAKRDLDGDKAVGAGLVLKDVPDSDIKSGVMDQTGGLFRVTSRGQQLYAVGTALAKGSSLDVSKSTLLNNDGSAWAPEGDFSNLRAVSTLDKVNKTTTWAVYGTDADNNVTEFKFDADLKLSAEEPRVLSAKDLAALEKQTLRDLNADNTFGVEIKGSIDTKSGLFKGSVLGQNFYLAGNNLQTGTDKSPTELSGTLLNQDGTAWDKPEGFKVASMVRKADGSGFSVYAYKEDEDGANKDTKVVLRFDFEAQQVEEKATGDFLLSEDSVDGVEVSAIDLAKAEASAKRDLNADTVFGVKIGLAADTIGGLYTASALGSDFLLLGKALTSSASKPLDLSKALLTADGEAWKPENVASIGQGGTAGANLRIVTNPDGNYEVYVKEDADAGSNVIHSRYTFDKDTFKQMGEKLELTVEDLAQAEKQYKRDLNGDSAFGVRISELKDAKAGLYIGAFESQSKVYLRSTEKLAIGSLVANKSIDLSAALQSEDGYWDVDEGYQVQGAYYNEDKTRYTVIASASGNTNDVRKYAFDTSNNNTLVEDESEELDSFELTALEAAQKRDFNGDGQVGVKVLAGETLDKTGGLHLVTLGQGSVSKDFFVVAQTPSAVKDLSTALLDSEAEAWGVPDGESPVALITRKSDGAISGYDVYTKNGDGQYVRYSFDADRKYKEDLEDNAKVLTMVELADEEAEAGRDINADKFAGAQVTQVLDKTGGLYQATIEGQTVALVTDSKPGKATKLGDKVLFDADGINAWKQDAGYRLSVVVKETDGNYSVYAVNEDDSNLVRRYSFDSSRVFQEQQDRLTAGDLVKAEAASGRDFNSDKAVGVSVGEAVDKKGALFKASVLGETFYVVGKDGKVPKTGTKLDNAVDLSRALLDANGDAWKPAQDWQVGGIVANDRNGYDVFTYKKDQNNNITDVTKSTWSDQFEFLSEDPADLVALVNLEATQKRDLSGDGVVGFRKLDSLSDTGYAGVTEARVAGDMTFLLAGSNLRAGTPTNALSIKNALLTEDGYSAWRPDEGFKVKAVDDFPPGVDGKRYVYAANSDTSGVRRYTFDKATGKVEGDAKDLTAVELAATELNRKRDLSGEGKIGVTLVSEVKDGARSTGLIRANVIGTNFLIAKSLPAGGKSIDLTAALVNVDGTAWEAPTDGSFAIKGIFMPTADSAEVYGTDADNKIFRFKFTKDVENGTLKLVDPDEEGGKGLVTGVDLANTEATAKKDLNGDGAIGFKTSGAATITQPNGFGIGRAKVDTPENLDDEIVDSPNIYIVGKMLDKMGQLANNLANNAALFQTLGDSPAYWSPGTDESVISLVQTSETPNKVSVYTKQASADGEQALNYVRYNFSLEDGKWVMDAAEDATKTFTSKELVAEESRTKRNLNNDSAVGLSASTLDGVSGLTQASIDGQNFYIVGSVSSGTGTRPLDLSNPKLLLDAQGNAWQPSGDATISGFEAVAAKPPEGTPDGAKYKVSFATGDPQYFDAEFKAVAGSAPAPAPSA